MGYSQDKIAQVMADLVLGCSARAAAEKHNVSHTTVSTWAKKLPELATKRDIGEQVGEHLQREISTLGTLLGYVEDKTFAGEYGDKIAVLYGVISDKAHTKLAALERAQREFQRDQDGSESV